MQTEIDKEHLPYMQSYLDSLDFSKFPKDWYARYQNKSPEDRAEWGRMRFRCLYDQIYLSGYVPQEINDKLEWEPVLGMDFQETPHRALFAQFLPKWPGKLIEIESAFIPMPLSDLDTQTKKRMILWPRGVFKTSAIIVEIIQTILNYPNVRICFLTGGTDLAKRQLKRVKRHFEKPSALFASLFPEFCFVSELNRKTQHWDDVEVKMGNAHEFTVPARTNMTFAEPTFAISTAKSVKAGSHYDLIFIDDLVNEQNYRSIKLLEKVYQDYLDICPLLEAFGFIVMTGTRYSYGDTYERIQEMAKKEEKEIGQSIWKFSIRDCWNYNCINCDHGDVLHDREINILEPPCTVCRCPGYAPVQIKSVLFPMVRTHDGRAVGHSLAFLEGERLRLGAEFFANQYENNPIASGTQTFTEGLIAAQTIFDIQLIPSFSQSQTIMIADLAYVGQEDRDYSVLFMCRIFQGQIFIFDCEFGHWDSGQVAENIVNLTLKHRPNMIYPEKMNGWGAYDSIITSYARSKGLQKLPMEWLQASNAPKAKLARIGSIKGVLAARRMWFFAGMKGYEILVQQLLKWPKLGRHDDFADCAGQAVAAPTGIQFEVPQTVLSPNNWLRRLSEQVLKTDDDQYRDNGAGNGITCG